jgi:hypothetical protein
MAKPNRLDDAFLNIIQDWTMMVHEGAASAVELIMSNSGEYLTAEQQKAVTDFHDLYFGEEGVAESKESVNREVDDLMDAIQAEMASGVPAADLSGIKEDEHAKQARLSLSGVQKKLETIIQLETGLKDKLVPVLTSMQFEDTLKQRLERMIGAWRTSLESLPATAEDVSTVAEKIGKSLGSAIEREAFYPVVLKRAAPKDVVDDLTMFESFS